MKRLNYFILKLILIIYVDSNICVVAEPDINASNSDNKNIEADIGGKSYISPENKINLILWSGAVEYGIIATTGNTNTRSESGKFFLQYEKLYWFNKFTTSYLKSSDSEQVSADQSSISNYTKYSLENKNYIFISLQYERDSFSGFLLRATNSIGYGFPLYNNNIFKWNMEFGVGDRQTQRSDGLGRVEKDTIIRLATDLNWVINKTSQFTETLQIENGSNNNFYESETVLKLKLNDILSVKFNLKVKFNSNVPSASKNTDSQTTVNIVYDF